MKKKYDNILVIDIGGGSTELVWLKFKEDCQDDRLDQLMKINLNEIQTPSKQIEFLEHKIMKDQWRSLLTGFLFHSVFQL